MSMIADIAGIAALIGDTGRAAMLSAVADGRALPAGELARAAGLTAQAASGHLARLMSGGLLLAEQQGRHRYYRLAGPHVAAALEGLAALAGPAPGHLAVGRTRAARELRYARRCYDHLAGELGVEVAAALQSRGFLAPQTNKSFAITDDGATWLSATFGIDAASLRAGRHGVACRCLDWTERRHHVAGPLGTTLFRQWCATGWLVRADTDRSVGVTPKGQGGLRDTLGIVARIAGVPAGADATQR